MSTSAYQTPPDWQHHPPPLIAPKELLPHHRHELEVESGIPAEFIEARGNYSTNDPAHLRSLGFTRSQTQPEMGPWRVDPLWNLAGHQRGFMIKADHPRVDDDGKILKYEALPRGVPTTQVDCHPLIQPLLRDPHRTKYFTEGIKKGDAAAARGLVTIALTGTYGFMQHKVVLTDELDEVRLVGCEARIAFDSDVMTKASVEDARRRLAKALDRREAKVSMTTFMPRADGSKCGFDDYFVDGGTPEGLDAITRRWTGEAPFERTTPPTDLETEVIQLRKKVAQQERHISALTYLFRDKALAPTDKAIAVSLLAESHAKRSRGEVEPDGGIRIEDRYIANDHRPATPKGIPRPETNNDGTYPITDRKRVKPILKKLKDAGAVTYRTEEVVKTWRATGDRYKVDEVIVYVSDDITQDLTKLAAHGAPKPKRAAYGSRQKECPHCGERHEWKVVCTGCGMEADKPRNQPGPMLQVVDDDYNEPDTPAERASEKNGEASNGDVAAASAPITYLSEKNGEAGRSRPSVREELDQRRRAAEPPKQQSMPDLREEILDSYWGAD